MRPGDRVWIHPGCAEPEILVDALLKRAPQLKDVELIHLMALGRQDCVLPQYKGHFRHNALFIGSNVRQAVRERRADYTPVFLGEIESLFLSGELPIDVAFLQTSPPDEHGFMSLGVSVDCTLTAARCARAVIAEVNHRMPRTHGDSFIHLSRVSAVVETAHPLPELPEVPLPACSERLPGTWPG